MTDSKPIVPSCMYKLYFVKLSIYYITFNILVVVQEEGSRKVLVYLNIPELKIKRSFPNFIKKVPANGEQRTLNFEQQ